jgi:hypothetical protein
MTAPPQHVYNIVNLEVKHVHNTVCQLNLLQYHILSQAIVSYHMPQIIYRIKYQHEMKCRKLNCCTFILMCHPGTCQWQQWREVEVWFCLFPTLVSDGGGWLISHALATVPLERALVPVVQKAGWVPRLVWMGVEKLSLATTKVKTPTTQEMLYWLLYPCLQLICNI